MSSVSAGSDTGNCFVSDWLLQTCRGLLRFDELLCGDRAISGDHVVQIMTPPLIHEHRLNWIVELRTSEALITVSLHHRVVTNLRPREIERAGDLVPGRFVVISGGLERQLVSVQHRQEECRLAEVYFHPDDPVDVFPPASILTMGQRRRQHVRRAGMNHRQGRAGNPDGQEQDGEDLVTFDSYR